jgi:type I restriction enzyme S subunit
MGFATDELKGCNVTRGIVPILIDKTSVKRFVYYQLLSPLLQKQIAENTNGTALKQINIKDLRVLKLFMPSIEEQHRIVRTLDTLSEKCRRLEQVAQQTIRECDALKQSILRQAFSGEL